ncbi:MAG TPA: hypothetical protein VJ946_13610 [Bacteroidales bacterium]|nr:hypothetical protein [Bacteroidales bacterium]
MKAKKLNKKILYRFSPWAWLILIAVSAFYMLINYAGTEGLNPSDEGVVLAQSWRILQGEVPHLDFISIRPVGSGVLHTIHFLLPFPLQSSARYFVLFQFFIIAFSWVQFFRLKSNFKHEIPTLYKLSFLLIAWVTSIFNYNLFPWTTIDAVFWTSLGFYLTERSFHIRRQTLCLGLGLMAFVLAALSRQTFALVAIVGWLWIAVRIVKRKSWTAGILGAAIGLIPLVIYAVVIAANDAGRAFLSQLTGRTEFYDTAVRGFYERFKLSSMKWIHLTIMGLTILLSIGKRLSSRLHSFLATLPALRIMFIVETSLVLILLYGIADYFITAETRDVFTLPFRSFWILLDIMLISVLVQDNKFTACVPAWFALLVAWVSAISLGANTPVFAFGILVISILYVFLIKYQDALLLKQNWLKVFIPAVAILFFATGTRSQQHVNYRDVGKEKQTHNLKEIHPDYGNCMTNQHTYAYLAEVDSLVKAYKPLKQPFVLLPDNAIVYPVYRMHNPMPVDWIQGPEFVGQEERFKKELLWKIDEGVIFMVQRVNAKNMWDGFEEIKYWKYPYVWDIHRECKLQDQTEFFDIYSKYPLEK